MNQPITTILERISDAIISLNTNWQIDFINLPGAELLGSADGGLIGKNIFTAFPAQTDADFFNACRLAMQEQQTIYLAHHGNALAHSHEITIFPSPTGLTIILKPVNKKSSAAELIRLSNERFLLAVRATNDMIWDWNLHTNDIWWNEQYNLLSGYPPNDHVHSVNTWMENIHPQDKQRVVDSIYAVINTGGEFWSEEYRYLKKDGTTLYIYDRGFVSRDENGKAFRMIGSMQNITDRILAAAAVKESEEKYRTLVEQASDAIYLTDNTGRLITVNSSACRLSHYTEAELLKMSIYDFVFEEDLHNNPFRFDDLKQGKTVLIERRFKIKDSAVLPVECIANMLSDGRILVLARDISERLKSSEEIVKEKNLSNSVINSLPGIFYLHNRDGVILRWNKNLEVISGHSAADLAKMHPLQLFDLPEQDLLLQKAREVFDQGLAEAEVHLVTKDNRKLAYFINGWKINYEGSACVIAIGINIDEKKKAEELLKQSYTEIRQLATHLTKIREEERRRIGREIHDELGQQLTAIKMDTVWIDKKTDTENIAIKEKLKNIITLLDGGNQSVRKILNELSPGVIDNHGLIEALERQNSLFTAATAIPIDFKTTAQKLELAQDTANGIFRVYQESLTNIMRYANASVVISSLQVTADAISVSIKDDGQGFDLHAQSKKRFGILGMKERVLSLNGSFTIDSAPGRGTSIEASIPLEQ
jgi:PAS domain S-box-containing protein